MTRGKVLVVDDERRVEGSVASALRRAGYGVAEAPDPTRAVRSARLESPDLILVPLRIAAADGRRLCRGLHDDRLTARIPIVLLTSHGDEAELARGRWPGVVDFVREPYDPTDLLTRVELRLREGEFARRDPPRPVRLRRGDLVIDSARYVATLGGVELSLSVMQFKLLLRLAEWNGRAISREELGHAILRSGRSLSSRAIDVHVLGMRRRLGAFGDRIVTVRGVGYRLALDGLPHADGDAETDGDDSPHPAES
jgi:two-component system phosphate regulon response regulator PhoB